MPVADKAIVCACEDVSVHDVENAIAQGYADIESLKRYTGLGTGPCQGKSCEVGAMRICAGRNAVPPAAQVPFRARPPLAPTTIAAYAGLPPEVTGARHPAGGLRPTWGKGAHPLQPHAALPERVDVVIIGGGIMGLALAWNLAGLRAGRVLVLERGYLCEGASGRNGGGVRQQWSTEINIRLMQESVELCRRFAVDLGVNVWFRQGGYLFLARTQKEVARLQKNIDLQNRCGVHTNARSSCSK